MEKLLSDDVHATKTQILPDFEMNIHWRKLHVSDFTFIQWNLFITRSLGP